jgi:hypothetical protein
MSLTPFQASVIFLLDGRESVRAFLSYAYALTYGHTINTGQPTNKALSRLSWGLC